MFIPLRVLATATPVAKVISGAFEGSISGLSIMESQIPPLGDSHFFTSSSLSFSLSFRYNYSTFRRSLFS
ncbi:hypothetical protein [Methanobrevibacter arboriphilus]|uniref:hypothetical protein n=1 Tax=Methanobrevibacter arboriphilus TaxID=39441 RepID=UPI000A638627|nr:hypothetical protein [Methanobrevibacter arboriphilus]